MSSVGIKNVKDKINLLFDLCDITGDAMLDREEIETVIQAMVQQSRLKVNHIEIKVLSQSFYEQVLKALNCATGDETATMIRDKH